MSDPLTFSDGVLFIIAGLGLGVILALIKHRFGGRL